MNNPEKHKRRLLEQLRNIDINHFINSDEPDNERIDIETSIKTHFCGFTDVEISLTVSLYVTKYGKRIPGQQGGREYEPIGERLWYEVHRYEVLEINVFNDLNNGSNFISITEDEIKECINV